MKMISEILNGEQLADERKNLNELEQYILENRLSPETALIRYRIYTLSRISGDTHEEAMSSVREFDAREYIVDDDGEVKGSFRKYTKDGLKLNWSGLNDIFKKRSSDVPENTVWTNTEHKDDDDLPF